MVPHRAPTADNRAATYKPDRLRCRQGQPKPHQPSAVPRPAPVRRAPKESGASDFGKDSYPKPRIAIRIGRATVSERFAGIPGALFPGGLEGEDDVLLRLSRRTSEASRSFVARQRRTQAISAASLERNARAR